MTRYLIVLSLLLLSLLVRSQDTDEKKKKNSKTAYNSALENIRDSNYDAALVYLNNAIGLDSSFTNAYLQRAKTATALGIHNQAENDLNRVIKLDPSNGEAYFYLGYITFRGDTGRNIIEKFDSAIIKGYRTPESFYYRGLYRLLAGDHHEAVDDLTSCIQLKQDHYNAYDSRAIAKYFLGDLQGALRDYKQCLSFRSDLPLVYFNIGNIKSELGDLSGAVEEYTIALKKDSTLYPAYTNRGYARYFLGDIPGSLSDFDLALKYHSSGNTMNNRACSLVKAEQLDMAMNVLNEILEKDNNYATAYLNRGLIKEMKGDLDGACSDWKAALSHGITEAEAYLKECK